MSAGISIGAGRLAQRLTPRVARRPARCGVRGLARGLALACLGLLSLAPVAGGRTGEEAPGGRWMRRAVDALELGDPSAAAGALDELAREDPAATPLLYLRARLAERRREWEGALAGYHRLLTRDEPGLDAEWFRLVSGRWVRARAARDVERVRAALLRETPPAAESLRTLVLPLEPLMLGEDEDRLRAEATALGLAAAEWTLQGLAQSSGLAQPTLAEALMLRRGQVALAAPGPEGDAGDPDAPPVSTLGGVILRLQFLEPASPPPWAPDSERPARYLPAATRFEETREITRAVAHFQSENDLAPTGIVDPETRRRLERAYRSARAERTLRAPTLPGDDPVLAAARRAGVAFALTGSLEPLGGEGWRWSAAWVSTSDGAVLGEPLQGTLSRRLFTEAWPRMVASLVAAWPGAREAGSLAEAAGEIPTCEGAILYGQALQALDDEDPSFASVLFARADRAGAGTTAGWFAQAWGLDTGALRSLERELLESAIRGPRAFEARLIGEASRWLARDLQSAGGAPDPAGLAPRAGLSVFPDQGWLRIRGHLQ